MQYLRLHPVLEDVTEHETILCERFLFNGGESHIKLKSPVGGQVTIETQLKNESYIMELFLATDALRRSGAKDIFLLAPYIPYSRQDRVMVPGEPLSIKVFAQMLNAQNYAAVYTLDNHSGVTTALIDRCIEIDMSRMIGRFILQSSYISVFIAPDAGAAKKVQALSRHFNMPIVQASKVRNTADGTIRGVQVHSLSLHEKHCLIVDDICDGGRTFIELAEALKLKGASSITLYVSHGIFSQGITTLLENIDRIFTANCFREDADIRHKITILYLRKEDLK